PWLQYGIAGFQAEADRVVPIAIDMGEGDSAAGGEAHGLLEQAFLEMDAPVLGIDSKSPKRRQDQPEQIVLVAIVALTGDALRFARGDDGVARMGFCVVALRGWRYPLEDIEAKELAARPHGIGDHNRRSAQRDAAFHHIARQPAAVDARK